MEKGIVFARFVLYLKPKFGKLWVLSLAVLIYAIFRSFSRNIAARQRENARWLALTAPIR